MHIVTRNCCPISALMHVGFDGTCRLRQPPNAVIRATGKAIGGVNEWAAGTLAR